MASTYYVQQLTAGAYRTRATTDDRTEALSIALGMKLAGHAVRVVRPRR